MKHPKVACPICHKVMGRPGIGVHMTRIHHKSYKAAYRDAIPVDETADEDQPRVTTRVLPPPVVPSGLPVSRELAEIALMGLRKTRSEIDGHIADLEAVLNPPTRGRPRGAKSANVPQQEGEIGYHYVKKNGWYQRIWDNDPEGLYRHKKTGEIFYTMDGQPSPKTAPGPGDRRSSPIKKVNGHAGAELTSR